MDIAHFLTKGKEANHLFKTLPPKDVFSLLEQTKSEDLVSLKKLLNPEVLHHQFLKLIHFLEEILEKETEQLIKKQETFPPATLTRVKEEEEELLKTKESLKKIQSVLEVALSVCWRGGYLELIEKLQTLKMYTMRTEQGVLKPLLTRVNDAKGSVFGQSEKDDDPAIDGLAAFGCWNLEQFRQLNLLKEKQPIEENSLTEEERDEAFRETKKALNRLGLNTVGDLKKREIYSKEALAAFIKKST